MDVKRYDLGKDQEHVCDCDMMDWPDGEFVMYDDIKHLPQLIEKLREALMWCSGSADFGEGGKARVGWLKCCEPLLRGDIKHLLPRPDPMSKEEAEKLVKDLVDKAMEFRQTSTLINQDALTDAADKLVAKLTIPRPDPAEVERLIDDCLRRYSLAHLALEDAAEENQSQEDLAECNERMNKARSDLLKLVGGE